MSDNQMQNLQEEEEKEIFSDISSESKSSHNSHRDEYDNDKRDIDRKNFVMKNGCCRDCMRAFSKTGKSCLCQVPKMERKYTLPEKGCHFCKCHGCNPVDVRKERRIELKKKLGDDNRILYKKQRILDSDDEDLKIYNNDVDDFNKIRKGYFLINLDILLYLQNNVTNANFFGYGVPMRTPTYILGYKPHSWTNEENYSNQNYKSRVHLSKKRNNLNKDKE